MVKWYDYLTFGKKHQPHLCVCTSCALKHMEVNEHDIDTWVLIL